jgi:DNA-binding MarR family transcriptional regulator
MNSLTTQSEQLANSTGIDAGSVAAWMRLARVFQKVDRRSAELFRRHGLSVAQFDVLAQVGASEGCTQQELADRLLVTKGNVCQLLDKMEARGWIERRSAAHGRSNLLYLTADGHRIRSDVLPKQEEHITRLFTSLDQKERTELNKLLRKLERSLD